MTNKEELDPEIEKAYENFMDFLKAQLILLIVGGSIIVAVETFCV